MSIWLIISTFIFQFQYVRADSFEVVLDPQIEVSSRGELTWYDLVRTHGYNEGWVKLLKEIKWEGDSNADITRGARQLRQRGAPFGTVRFTIPNEVQVHRIQGFSQKEFERKALRIIAKICLVCEVSIHQVRINIPENITDWRIDESSVKLATQNIIAIHSSRGTTWGTVLFNIKKPALVATQMIFSGELINAENSETRLVELNSQSRKHLDLTVWGKVQARKQISTGKIILEDEIQQPELVKRGQSIEVFSGGDFYQVSTQGLAESSGRDGEVIRVKNIESGKIFSAKVISAGKVRVD